MDLKMNPAFMQYSCSNSLYCRIESKEFRLSCDTRTLNACTIPYVSISIADAPQIQHSISISKPGRVNLWIDRRKKSIRKTVADVCTTCYHQSMYVTASKMLIAPIQSQEGRSNTSEPYFYDRTDSYSDTVCICISIRVTFLDSQQQNKFTVFK